MGAPKFDHPAAWGPPHPAPFIQDLGSGCVPGTGSAQQEEACPILLAACQSSFDFLRSTAMHGVLLPLLHLSSRRQYRRPSASIATPLQQQQQACCRQQCAFRLPHLSDRGSFTCWLAGCLARGMGCWLAHTSPRPSWLADLRAAKTGRQHTPQHATADDMVPHRLILTSAAALHVAERVSPALLCYSSSCFLA